jgi:NitT/TauT family transport system substrate-binding protein
MLQRREFGLALLAMPALARSARAEASGLRIARQYGLPYLPLMVMEHEKLVEKHLAGSGQPNARVEWVQMGGTAALTDALLSGSVDFAAAGVTALITLWDKTVGTAREVVGLSAVQNQPYMLVTNNPAIKTIADITAKDRIALPSVKISSQAVTLEMAAAKLWGDGEYARLDPMTVTLPHPDAMTSLLSNSGSVDCHQSVAPYYYYELADPHIHLVLRSYDTIGKHVNGVMIGAKQFNAQNPNLCAALYAAQEEANAFIRSQPLQAAEIYLAMAGDKRSSAAEMAKMVADPDNDWTTTPAGVGKMTAFMHKVGRMRHLPASWKDLYMPEVHGLPGT